MMNNQSEEQQDMQNENNNNIQPINMIQNQGIRLHYAPGSPFCRKVQILLEEKQIPYQPHPISLQNQDHKTEFFLTMNPRGKVPTLVDGDIILYESTAIILYLEDRYRDIMLIPSDPTLKALVFVRMMETQYIGDALLLFRSFLYWY